MGGWETSRFWKDNPVAGQEAGSSSGVQLALADYLICLIQLSTFPIFTSRQRDADAAAIEVLRHRAGR